MCRKRDVWMLLNNHFANLGIPKHVHDADMWPRRYSQTCFERRSSRDHSKTFFTQLCHICSGSISVLSLNSTCCAVVRTTAFQVLCAQTLREWSTKHTVPHVCRYYFWKTSSRVKSSRKLCFTLTGNRVLLARPFSFTSSFVRNTCLCNLISQCNSG